MNRQSDCPLYGTQTCAMLHMRSCDQCVNNVSEEENLQHTEKLVKTYLEKIPEGGPAHLFESDSCTLCKGTPGKKDGYAVYTFGHAEPKTVIKHLIIKRRANAGMMVPLQFAVCKKCRAKMLVYDYFTLAMTVLFGTTALIVISRQAVADRLNAVNELLPLLLWAAWTGIGYLAGLLGRRAVYNAFSKKMYLNIRRHPFVRQMMQAGWFPIPEEDRPKAVFCKHTLDSGLGTAPGEAYVAEPVKEEE